MFTPNLLMVKELQLAMGDNSGLGVQQVTLEVKFGNEKNVTSRFHKKF